MRSDGRKNTTILSSRSGGRIMTVRSNGRTTLSRKMVVFITDGKPTLGETDEEKLLAAIKKQNGSAVRIFTFGVGYDINTHLLDRLTDMTRAYRTYISPKEDIEKAVSSFYAKIQSPVLTDISVKISGVKGSKIYPRDLPDLYSGSSITVF